VSALERRRATVRRLAADEFDLLVIGGGITGAGIARDAALRGFTTALLEQHDFASGTSSRSSRLVHGGVRYLEHGHLHLVFESCRERRTLLAIAPHLVRPLAFTWPVYRGARISRPKLFAGLALYDTLALFRNIAPHERLHAGEILRGEPALGANHLLGGARYYDASTNDARLTLANVIGAADAGAAVLNHAAATDLVVHRGRAVGVSAADQLRGERVTVRARMIVNATGPWTDTVQHLESSGVRPAILGSKGAHIAVPRGRLGNRQAVTMLHPDDGRVMFALPAGELAIIGTTETATDAAPAETRASRDDVRYLLAAANAYFPHGVLGERDVISAWAGIRPLAAGLAAGDAGSASREHAITHGALGIVSVTGGKLTTYRAVAEEVVDQVADVLGRPYRQRCRTAQLPLPGGEPEREDGVDPSRVTGVAADAAERLRNVYGSRWPCAWALVQSRPELSECLTPALPTVLAELVYAVEHELAITLGDVLMRRTTVAFGLRDHGLELAPRVASLLAQSLGWDAARARDAVDAYEREIERVFRVD